MDHFTPVDTIGTSNFLRAVITPDLKGTLQFLLPVTGFEDKGQPVMPPGFDHEYGLYLAIDGSILANPNGSANTFTSLNISLWADPGNNDGTPSVSETRDPSFSNGSTNDILLATGTMVSASMSINPDTLVRSADFVDSMTPTLAGRVLLHDSIKPGTELEVKTTTQPSEYTSFPQPGGGFINVVDGGAATVTLDPQGTVLLANIPTDALHFTSGPRFIYGHRGEGYGRHDQRT
ncbi:MAG TPA: hypothetical protein VMU81_16385 [Acetobacteraceae bacterium]|nr:hypothetical protein [Acetobacteraceae bacterium]